MPFVRRIRVLVVEDDDDLRELYRHAFSNAGFAVTAVADGLAALRMIDEGLMPQIVILDLALPYLSGNDLFWELRGHANTQHVPVIVVTGTDTRLLNPTEFAFVFRKPAAPETLVRAIDAAVTGHRP